MKLRGSIFGLIDLFKYDNWFQLLISRLFFRFRGTNVYFFKGLKIIVNNSAGDLAGLNSCLFTEMYFKLIKKIKIPEKPIILDIGSHIGGFSILLKTLGIKPLKMVCVEMNPSTFKRLWFNIRENFDCDLDVINAALAGKNGYQTLYLGAGSTGDNLISGKIKSLETNGQLIQFITFDSLYESYLKGPFKIIDLCKIDIEGGEYPVFLESKKHKKLKRCRYLIIEIHGENPGPKNKLIKRFEELGFCKEDDVDSKNNVFLFTNNKLMNKR
jgi:FkbM family methyltransferase